MNGKRVLTATVVVALILGLGMPVGAGEFFFKDGDTVVVMGDSITEQHLYSNYLEAWTLMRFPTWKITFHNVGIGGDSFPGRQRSICARRSGIQAHGADGGLRHERRRYRAFDQSLFDNYMAGLTGIAKQAKEARSSASRGSRPAPWTRRRTGRRSRATTARWRSSPRASRRWLPNGGLFVDQFHPCLAVEDKARAAKPSNRMGGGDAVHFGPPGQAVMASAILKGMSFPTLRGGRRDRRLRQSRQERQLQGHRGAANAAASSSRSLTRRCRSSPPRLPRSSPGRRSWRR